MFVHTAEGRAGWCQLTPSCRDCAQGHPVLTGASFAALSGERGLTVSGDDSPLRHFEHPHDGTGDQNTAGVDRRGCAHGRDGRDHHGCAGADGTALVDAEFAVLHARIDELQAELDHLLHQE